MPRTPTPRAESSSAFRIYCFQSNTPGAGSVSFQCMRSRTILSPARRAELRDGFIGVGTSRGLSVNGGQPALGRIHRKIEPGIRRAAAGVRNHGERADSGKTGQFQRVIAVRKRVERKFGVGPLPLPDRLVLPVFQGPARRPRGERIKPEFQGFPPAGTPRRGLRRQRPAKRR